MICHVSSCGPPEMSCFAMVRRASGPIAVRPYPACRSSILFRSTPFPPPTLQMAALPPPRRMRRTLQLAALPPPLASPRGGTLFRAYRAPAPARRRALAPARFARLIAHVRATAQAQGARLPSVSMGFFRAGAGAKGSGLRMPRPPANLGMPCVCQDVLRNISDFCEHRACNAAEKPSPSGRGSGEAAIRRNAPVRRAHSSETGRPGVLSRETKTAHSSSVRAAWRPTSARSDPSPTRPSGRTAPSRPRWASSGRFRIVGSVMSSLPSRRHSGKRYANRLAISAPGAAERIGESFRNTPSPGMLVFSGESA